MIVDTGKVQLLDDQRAYLAGCQWGLFTSNTTISAGSNLASLTEAAWAGYARVTVGTVGASTIVGPRSQAVPALVPIFVNSSGADVTFYGWFLVDPIADLVAAVNIGATVIPDGLTYGLSTAFTDRQE